ncbi:MAG: hypothetical protein ACJ8EP_06370, partial [Sphingomicrobium sp.]
TNFATPARTPERSAAYNRHAPLGKPPRARQPYTRDRRSSRKETIHQMQQPPATPEEPRPDMPQPAQPGQPTPVPPETPTRSPDIDVPAPGTQPPTTPISPVG